MLFTYTAAVFTALQALTFAQSTELSGKVGPLTSIEDKKAVKTCDITDYGGKPDSDISSAINDAFAACKTGGVVVIPSGNYNLENWVVMKDGKAWALQLDGVITRAGKEEGNMIFIEHTSDFELFSTTSKGAIQGHGFEFHKEGSIGGPRLLRLYDVSDFAVHDIALVDSPAFHLTIDTCKNGEIYNMAIRGGAHGGLDGISLWSENMWVHDVMVTNKDECVTVKSPSKNILVENVYCNWSGGCAMGSLGQDVDVSDITYRNIYTVHSDQMYMLKSNGGSGTVSNVVLENFIGHSNAYSLDIEQYWKSMKTLPGDGVQISNLKINNWTGTALDGMQRGPLQIKCADGAPCTGVDVTDFNMWTEKGDSQFYSCQSAYTDLKRAEPLYCMNGGTGTGYPITTRTVTAAPTGYEAPKLADDLETDFGFTVSIPVPAMPTSFFPNQAPIKPLAGGAQIES